MDANALVTMTRLGLPEGDAQALGELIEAADWHCRAKEFNAPAFTAELRAIVDRSRQRGSTLEERLDDREVWP